MDWGENGQSIYNTPKGVELSLGKFHAGTVFKGKISLGLEDHLEFETALKRGYQPVFWVIPNNEPRNKPGVKAAYRARKRIHKQTQKG